MCWLILVVSPHTLYKYKNNDRIMNKKMNKSINKSINQGI